MAKNKEVTTTNQQTNISVVTGAMGSFGFDAVTTKDIKIPLIYIAQNMSKLVDAGIARPGDIVENLENQVIAKKDGSARLVPFYFQKSYQVQRVEDGKKIFVGNEAWDGERAYEEEINGTTQYNTPTFNFFVMREGDPSHTRYLLSFRGSRNISGAGKIILSQLMTKFQSGKAAPYNFVIEVSAKQAENKKGKWFVFSGKLARNEDGTEAISDISVRPYAQKAATEISDMLNSGINIDTSELTDSEPVETKDNF